MSDLKEAAGSLRMLEAENDEVVFEGVELGDGAEEALCRSMCPRSRDGSMMFRMRFLSSFVSAVFVSGRCFWINRER